METVSCRDGNKKGDPFKKKQACIVPYDTIIQYLSRKIYAVMHFQYTDISSYALSTFLLSSLMKLLRETN